ncbi:hypothetical protein GCM10027348_11170 [Hymenobacter tenuis]
MMDSPILGIVISTRAMRLGVGLGYGVGGFCYADWGVADSKVTESLNASQSPAVYPKMGVATAGG